MKVIVCAESTFNDVKKSIELDHLEEFEKYLKDEEFLKDLIDDDCSWGLREWIVTRDDVYCTEGYDFAIIIYDSYRE